MLEKMTALQDDVDNESKARADREQAKNERDVAKMCDLLAKKGY